MSEEVKDIEITRRAGEESIVQLSDGSEFTLACVSTTQTQCVLRISPGTAIKRILKVEK